MDALFHYLRRLHLNPSSIESFTDDPLQLVEYQLRTTEVPVSAWFFECDVDVEVGESGGEGWSSIGPIEKNKQVPVGAVYSLEASDDFRCRFEWKGVVTDFVLSILESLQQWIDDIIAVWDVTQAVLDRYGSFATQLSGKNDGSGADIQALQSACACAVRVGALNSREAGRQS